jgi:hypothetical protein
MNRSWKKFILPAIVIIIIVIVGVICYQSVFQEEEPRVAIPLPQSNSTSDTSTTDASTLPLTISLSQMPNSNNTLKRANITRGGNLTINVNLLLRTERKELNVPLYLSIGAFENKPVSKIISTAPSPYPFLPWPDHEDSPNMTKPFEASFSSNPINLEPGQKTSTTLTITALDDAQLGTYTLMIELGDWKETGTGGALFYLTVLPD